MFKLEMESMFSSAQNKKLNKYDIDHTDNLEISSNHIRNLWEFQNKLVHFFTSTNLSFTLSKATNKSATTHNKILMSSVPSAVSVILTELC